MKQDEINPGGETLGFTLELSTPTGAEAQDAATYRTAAIRTEYQPNAARYHQTLYLAAP